LTPGFPMPYAVEIGEGFVNRRRFEELVEEAIASLPEELFGFVDNVVFLVEDWPDFETLDAMGIEEQDGLLGLYQGHPLSERSTELTGTLPDRVVLYQRPIERHSRAEGVPVVEVIRDTLLHEVGHHFGLSEAELHRLEGEDEEP